MLAPPGTPRVRKNPVPALDNVIRADPAKGGPMTQSGDARQEIEALRTRISTLSAAADGPGTR